VPMVAGGSRELSQWHQSRSAQQKKTETNSRCPIRLQHVETFPGAACCVAIELPSYKAAPLQALGSKQVGRATKLEDENDYDWGGL
jgi:hypothetical protein